MAEPEPWLVAHEQAHATVARHVGWHVLEVGFSPRGASGSAKYLMPPGDEGTWRELYVTLASQVSDVRHDPLLSKHAAQAREGICREIVRKTKCFLRQPDWRPARSDDEWKAALILTQLHGDRPELIERELREAWDEVETILADGTDG
jgi:hypothetical protein